jgi:hypothetical protein
MFRRWCVRKSRIFELLIAGSFIFARKFVLLVKQMKVNENALYHCIFGKCFALNSHHKVAIDSVPLQGKKSMATDCYNGGSDFVLVHWSIPSNTRAG